MSVDPFWAEQRAIGTNGRSEHAGPTACGTCRGNVQAGGRVEHEECSQRATLLQAPDHPSYELLAGFSLEENAKLPARFHIPVFDDCGKPNAWLCAVCWEDGVVSSWPCKTAMEQGTKVFTPAHEAETASRRQAARIVELEKQLAEYEALNPQQCPAGQHADWLVNSEYTHACPWCRIAVLEDEDSHPAKVAEYLSTPYMQDAVGMLAPQSGPARPKPDPTAEVDRWNALYPVGTPVFAYPDCRPEDDPKDEQLTTRTRSKAEVRGYTAVVWVDGHSACINLTHVDPRPETGGAS